VIVQLEYWVADKYDCRLQTLDFLYGNAVSKIKNRIFLTSVHTTFGFTSPIPAGKHFVTKGTTHEINTTCNECEKKFKSTMHLTDNNTKSQTWVVQHLWKQTSGVTGTLDKTGIYI